MNIFDNAYYAKLVFMTINNGNTVFYELVVTMIYGSVLYSV